MARSGGKGKVSNNLVAASCAAVLAVYAAGYWRTRDAARRFETQAEERKPTPPQRPAAVAAEPAEIVTARAAAPAPETLPTVPPPQTAAITPSTAQVTAKTAAKAAAPEQLPPVATAPTGVPPPVESVAVAEAVTSVVESDPAATPASDVVPVPSGTWRDGSYTGWGTSRHGDIKAQVVIKDGRIVESSIASCETRWPCDVISTIIHQPVERQSADVDRVSRATESANAYYYALVAALGDALVSPPAQITTR